MIQLRSMPAVLAGAALLWGCHKPTSIGTEIRPGGPGFHAITLDVDTLFSWVDRDDSLITSLHVNYLLGSLDDNRFGKSYAGIFTQLRLPSGKTAPGPLTLDSAVLVLPFRAPAYGDPAAIHNIAVYRVTEDLVFEETYREQRSFQYDPVELGRITEYKPNDTSGLRIHLNRSFGEALLNESQTATFNTQGQFLAFLKGLYIAPDTSGGFSNSMMQVDLLATASTLSLHYRNADNDTLVYSFVIGGQAATQNVLLHNYSAATAEVLLGNQAADSIEAYLEGASGLRVVVRLPDLQSLGPIAINKAELVLTVIDDTTYASPGTILPRVIGDSLDMEALSDAALDLILQTYDLGGTLETETDGGNTYERYRISIAKHLYLLNRGETTQNEIILQISPPTQTPARVRVGGYKHPDLKVRMKLHLLYTKLS